MTSSQTASSVDELEELRGTVATLAAELAGLRDRPAHRSRARARRTVSAIAGIAVAGLLLFGVAGASTPGNPADVNFISLSVPHKILSNASIARGAANSPVVIGGSSTVPSDATSVRLIVAVKSTAAGTLFVFPADHSASTSSDTISFPGGNQVITQQTQQNPGLSGKVTFVNGGTATASVTVTITGYSTQTTASNISGSGGTAGQVLTNYAGSGAVWTTQGQAYSSANGGVEVAGANDDVISVTVPSGTYQAMATFFADASVAGIAKCWVASPAGNQGMPGWAVMALSSPPGGPSYGSGSAQALITTTGGAITLQCQMEDVNLHTLSGFVGHVTLTATQVNAGHGDVIP